MTSCLVSTPSHLASLSSNLLLSSPHSDLTMVTHDLTLRAHQAMVLPRLPMLQDLLPSSCFSCSDPLLLLLPDTPGHELKEALAILYMAGDPQPLANLLGLEMTNLGINEFKGSTEEQFEKPKVESSFPSDRTPVVEFVKGEMEVERDAIYEDVDNEDKLEGLVMEDDEIVAKGEEMKSKFIAKERKRVAKIKLEGERFKCYQCPYKSNKKSSFDSHMERKHSQRSMVCTRPWCDILFSTLFERSQHIKLCFLNCNYCEKKFERQSHYARHMEAELKKIERQKVQSDLNLFIFTGESSKASSV